MRTFWRTAGLGLLRDIGAIALASGFVGVSYGAIAVASGIPGWAVVALSVFVFAGGSQFLVVGMFGFGGPLAAIVGGLLLNARHMPYGMAVADVLAGSWARRLVGSHLLIDESMAFALAQPDLPKRRSAYWLTGIALFVCWQTGTVLGIQVGNAVGDPDRFGLDAAFPAALLALLLPRLREAAAARVALLGATVAVVATFFVPAGLPVLLALVGLFAAGRQPPTRPAALLAVDAGPPPVGPAPAGSPPGGTPTPPPAGSPAATSSKAGLADRSGEPGVVDSPQGGTS